MFKKKLIILILLLAVLAVVVPHGADAAGIVPCGGDGESRCTLCHLVIGIKNIIDYGFKILIFVALAAITISGVMYIISSGSEDMMKKAKEFIRQTLVGFAIVLGGWLIINYAMVLLSAKDSNNDGVPDFGFVSTGGWSNFTCDVTPIAPGGGGIVIPTNPAVDAVNKPCSQVTGMNTECLAVCSSANSIAAICGSGQKCCKAGNPLPACASSGGVCKIKYRDGTGGCATGEMQVNGEYTCPESQVCCFINPASGHIGPVR